MATKQKTKRIKAVQQKLRVFRAQEPLLSVIVWGVHHTVNELRRVHAPVMLMPDDFKASSKIQVRNHLFNKNNKPGFYSFKEYSPLVFRNLRQRFNVEEDDYMNSMSSECLEEMDSSGRSGSRFLLTGDHRFIIKTISTDEADELHRILKDYHHYIVEQHGQTLLPHFLGMYKVLTNDIETHFFVTNNVFNKRFSVHKKYDLKGSTVDREASERERSKPVPTLKDKDFVREGVSVHLSGADRENFMCMLQRDTDFLSQLHLMDYSLLVGVHHLDHPSSHPSSSDEQVDDDIVTSFKECSVNDDDNEDDDNVTRDIHEGTTNNSNNINCRTQRAISEDHASTTYNKNDKEVKGGKHNWKGRLPVSFDLEHPTAFNVEPKPQTTGENRRFSLQNKTTLHNPFFWLQGKHSQQKQQQLKQQQQQQQLQQQKNQEEQKQQHQQQKQHQQQHPKIRRVSIDKQDLGPFGFMASPNSDQEVVYFMALLDILTHYGMRKRTAHTAKTVKHGAGAEISTVKPAQYAKRFMDFIGKAVIS